MSFLSHQLDNGLTLVAEPMEYSSSASFSIYIPGGAAYDDSSQLGGCSLLVEMLGKGTTSRDSRALSEAFDSLGVSRSRSSGVEAISFSAAMLPQNLAQALSLTAEMILHPGFPKEELQPVRQLALQELRSLEDEPSSKAMVELSGLFYPAPFGNPSMGTLAGVENCTLDDLASLHRKLFTPSGVVIGVAGKFDWDKLKEQVETSFGAWSGETPRLKPGNVAKSYQSKHVQKESNQMQLALAYPSVDYSHENYYTAKVANGVLSGGMSGRLFIEVREKRGLVYRVSSSHSGSLGRAAVISYAGTTPQNARECLDVMYGELSGLQKGVSEDELGRAKADLKSRLVMQSEISSARASSIAHNWWSLGRVKSLDEIKNSIDKVTSEAIVEHSKKFPAEPVSLLTIGPEALELHA